MNGGIAGTHHHLRLLFLCMSVYHIRAQYAHTRRGHRLPRIPTAGMWGTVGAVGLVWVTDWRLILDWVPYINGKFKKDD